MEFEIKHLKKPKLKKPILIEGLPGIGNVGKIALDFIIDSLKAEKIVEIHSPHFPHSVFINEANMIDLPIIEIYHKRVKKQDILLLAGDVQPVDEASCYKFCQEILSLLEKWKGQEIITMGGIGLQKIPTKPKVYITGNNKKITKTFKGCNNKIYGVVGPIIGVTGMLVGLATLKKIPAAALLAQTFGHPAYLGIKGAKEILQVLNAKYKLKINTAQLTEEMEEIEKELKSKTEQISGLREAKPKPRPLDYFG